MVGGSSEIGLREEKAISPKTKLEKPQQSSTFLRDAFTKKSAFELFENWYSVPDFLLFIKKFRNILKMKSEILKLSSDARNFVVVSLKPKKKIEPPSIRLPG